MDSEAEIKTQIDNLTAQLETEFGFNNNESKILWLKSKILEFLSVTNKAIQNNLDTLPHSQIQIYAERVNAYCRLNEALIDIEMEKGEQKYIERAKVDSHLMYKEIYNQYLPYYKNGDEKIRSAIMEGVIVPHNMLVIFFNSYACKDHP